MGIGALPQPKPKEDTEGWTGIGALPGMVPGTPAAAAPPSLVPVVADSAVASAMTPAAPAETPVPMPPAEHEEGAHAEDAVDASLFGAATAAPAPGATAEAPKVEGRPAFTVSRRRRRKEASGLSQLIGTVGGGMIGLFLGYCIMNLIWGPRMNFLDISWFRAAASESENSSSESSASQDKDSTAKTSAEGKTPGETKAPSPDELKQWGGKDLKDEKDKTDKTNKT
jgi:hypothetical protein